MEIILFIVDDEEGRLGDNVKYWYTHIEVQEQTTVQRSGEEESDDPREYLASVEGTSDTWAQSGLLHT